MVLRALCGDVCVHSTDSVSRRCQITLALPLSSGAEGIGPWRFYYESRECRAWAVQIGHMESDCGFLRNALCVTEGVAEKIENITTKYGYWSTTELWKFDNVTGNSTRVPFDAHELVALVAPVRRAPYLHTV